MKLKVTVHRLYERYFTQKADGITTLEQYKDFIRERVHYVIRADETVDFLERYLI